MTTCSSTILYNLLFLQVTLHMYCVGSLQESSDRYLIPERESSLLQLGQQYRSTEEKSIDLHELFVREASDSLESSGGSGAGNCMASPDELSSCPADIDVDYRYLWPQTNTTESRCGKCLGNTAEATRMCLENCTWDTINCTASQGLIDIYKKLLSGESSEVLIEALLVLTNDTSRQPEVLSELYLLSQVLDEVQTLSPPFHCVLLRVCSNLLDIGYRNKVIQASNEVERYQAGTLLVQSLNEYSNIGLNNNSDLISIQERNIRWYSCNNISACVLSINENGLVQMEVENSLESTTQDFTIIVYPNITGYLPSSRSNFSDIELATPVVSYAQLCTGHGCKSNEDEDANKIVTLTFPHNLDTTRLFETICVDFKVSPSTSQTSAREDSGYAIGEWSTGNCEKVSGRSNTTHTVCSCLGWGTFSALQTPIPVILSPADELALQLINAVGSALSILCLLVTIAAYIGFRALWGLSSGAYVNTCISSIFLTLSFTVRGDMSDNQTLCSIFAVLKHYFLTVTCLWLIVNGIVLLMLSIISKLKYKIRYYILVFTLLVYGVAFLYLCVSVPVGFLLWREELWGYGEPYGCFLRTELTYFGLFYIVPICILLMAGLVLLVSTIGHCIKLICDGDVNTTVQYSAIIVQAMTLLYYSTMSLTLPFTQSRVLQYISTTLLSFRGVFLFICYVLCLTKAREQVRLVLIHCFIRCKHVFVWTKFKEKGHHPASLRSSVLYDPPAETDISVFISTPVSVESVTEAHNGNTRHSLTTKSAKNQSDVSLWRLAIQTREHRAPPTIEELEEKTIVMTFL